MIMDLFGQLSEKKDQLLASVVGEIMSSEHFMALIEKIVSTSGFIDQKIQIALNTFRVASRREVEDVEERLVRLERKLTRTITAFEELREQVEKKTRKTAQVPEKLEGVCDHCGKTFLRKTVNQRYCSAACRSAAV